MSIINFYTNFLGKQRIHTKYEMLARNRWFEEILSGKHLNLMDDSLLERLRPTDDVGLIRIEDHHTRQVAISFSIYSVLATGLGCWMKL